MKKIFKNIVLLMIVFSLCTCHASVIATSIHDLQNQQENIKNNISSKKEKLNGVKQEKTETLEQVENLISQISSYKNEIDELNNKISELEKKINNSQMQIKKDEEEYAKKQNTLDERLVTMYKTGETSYLDFMLSSSSLIDFISSYYLIAEVANYDTLMLEELEQHKQKIEQEKQELEENKTELNSSKKTVETKKSALQVAKKTKEKYVEELDENEKKIQEELEELQEANDEIDKEIEAAQEEIKKAREEAARKANNNTYSPSTSSPSSSGFIRPVSSQFRIGTRMYYSPNGIMHGAYHGAVDFSGQGILNQPVYAVADGYVSTSKAKYDSSGNYTSYGNYIVIAHYNGLYTLYAHLNKRYVSKGQTVKQGQVIGLVGSTGKSTGPHLHFEVRTGDGESQDRVNPEDYLP